MLGHPISSLSPELIGEIVDWVAILGGKKDLQSLLQCDRSFRDRCRATLFETVSLNMAQPRSLRLCWNVLGTDTTMACYVRRLEVRGAHGGGPQDVWLGNEPRFNNIIHILSNAPRPLTLFKLSGRLKSPSSFLHWMTNSFFAADLVKLHVSSVNNFPLRTLRAFQNLRSVQFDTVGSPQLSMDSKGTCSSEMTVETGPRPELEELKYHNSHEAVRTMLAASWGQYQFASLNKLRVLRGHARDHEGLSLIQALINENYSTLEDVGLSNMPPFSKSTYPAFSGFLDLKKLKYLRRFTMILPIYETGSGYENVAPDIAGVLSTISASANVVNLITLQITSFGEPPWPSTRSQRWLTVVEEIARISLGRDITLELRIAAYGPSEAPGSATDSRCDLYLYMDTYFRRALAPHGHVNYCSLHHK
ncbi:hypothetical protein BKA70DRAFT_1189303 [Coprinopsis sp. MPI-PUGE-AT-0042]|nr:hypothetical protein BKA70DRAFT_1189303 [Coprinopsis sp. MPI-PUGE-AT-0042]